MKLRPATARDGELLENLFNLYRNDLSFCAKEFRFLDDRGYFDRGISGQLLPFGDGVETYIIEEDGHPVELIVVTGEDYALPGCAWRFQELYLIRPARGRGLAFDAAAQLLRAHPGRWCLSVYTDNLPAYSFWKKLVSARGRLLSEAPGEDGMTDIIFETI